MISDPRARRVDTTRRNGAAERRRRGLQILSTARYAPCAGARKSGTARPHTMSISHAYPCRQHSKQSVDKTVTGKLASSLFLRDRSRSVSLSELIKKKPWKISRGTDQSTLTSLVRLQILHPLDLFILEPLPSFNLVSRAGPKVASASAELPQGHQDKNKTESRGLQL